MKATNRESLNSIKSCFEVLDLRDRFKVMTISLIQISLSILDLVGVALVGVLGALAVNGVQSRPAGLRVTSVLDLLGISELNFQNQVAALAIFAAAVLVLKTLASVYLTRKVMFFLSRRGAKISGNLLDKLLCQDLLTIQERPTQDHIYALTGGVTSITMGVLSTITNMVADAALLITLFSGLVLIDPDVALCSLIVFVVIGYVLYWLQQKRAKSLGILLAELSIQSNERILEVLSSYRELVVRNRRKYYAREILKLRENLADAQAEISFLPQVSKYVVEATVILGTVIISGVQFWIQDATHAVATLTVFLAAGSRIAPAVLRFQQGAISIKANIAASIPTLEMIQKFENLPSTFGEQKNVQFAHDNFTAKISLSQVAFTYPGNRERSVDEIDLEISEGTFVAIVGPSGAGKTTLVDILLGILKPSTGEIRISEITPAQVMETWPGAIGYVPQDILIADGTVRENVALGYGEKDRIDKYIWSALRIASLEDTVNEFPLGINQPVGERGSKLSGGQRQRLGIARALYTKPKILVLDEATSALDGAIEFEITETIKKMKGKTTIIAIAHRLSTVREADVVVYMESGRIIMADTFENVRKCIPNFDHQATLMGL